MFAQKYSKEKKSLLAGEGWGLLVEEYTSEIGGSKSCGCDMLVSIGILVLMNNARTWKV